MGQQHQWRLLSCVESQGDAQGGIQAIPGVRTILLGEQKSIVPIWVKVQGPFDDPEIEIGEAVYRRDHRTGIGPDAWDSLRRTKVFLKAPITTPQGGGYKSLNVTVRKALLALLGQALWCRESCRLNRLSKGY